MYMFPPQGVLRQSRCLVIRSASDQIPIPDRLKEIFQIPSQIEIASSLVGPHFLPQGYAFFSYVFCYSGIKFSFKYFLRLFFYFNLAQVKGLSSSFSTIQNSFLISLLLLLLQNSSIFLSISSDLSLLFSEIYWKA